MKKTLAWLIWLYVLALNTSMAGMEIVVWTIMAVVLVQLFRRPDFAIVRRNRFLNFWLVVMVLAVLGSLLSNPLYKPFLFQLGFMRWVPVLWGLVFALREAWDVQFESVLVRVWMWAVGINGAYATLQNLSGVDFLRNDALETPGGGVWRAVGWYSESLNFVYSYGMSAFAISRPALTRYRRWGLVVCILGGMGIIAAISRGAWLAGILCVLFYLFFERRIWVLPATAGFYLLTRLLTWYSPGFAGKIQGMETLHVDPSSAIRMDLWRAYWQMFIEHPWFGIGFLQGDELLPGYYKKLGIEQEFVSHAHNNFLQALGGAGIFCFISYCTISLIFAYKTWRMRHFSAWGWSLLLAQMYLQAGGMTQCNFISGMNNQMLVFIWAMVLVLEDRLLNASKIAQPKITM
jgi:O-antigen ligase